MQGHVQDVIVRLLLTISLFSISTIHAEFAGNETDRIALLAIKHSILQDPQRTLSSWNDSFHFCRWKGVTCGRRHQRVTGLDFFSKGLAGPLSPYIGNLSFLRTIRISNNSFHGEIPPQLGHLFRLRTLNLFRNKFEGKIPANISRCSSLLHLFIADNKLVGKIPEDLIALPKLRKLLVGNNNLTGGIPTFIANLTLLEILSFTVNPLGGSLPYSIGQLKNLFVLDLDNTNLSGMISPSLYNLSQLTELYFDDNQLQGSLAGDIGSMFPQLKTLQVSNNQFTGSLPISLSNCSHLNMLQLDGNNFNGKIAVDFGHIKNLTYIVLSDNNFGSGEPDEMNFISSAANCSNLEILEFDNNKLRGSLPNSVGNLSSQMFFLHLGENMIYGRLPSTIGNLVGLTTLALDDNQFTGTIPSSIGNLQNLQRLAFESNRFSGTIPHSIGNMSLLIELYMGMNGFEGIIPQSLGNCQSLILLDLSHNSLSGLIPRQLFSLSALSSTLSLAHNHLVGVLPSEVGNLKNLATLDLSENGLSGEIPSSLGRCSSLENLYIQENIFQDSIPSSLSSLKGLINLDASGNNLSGKIPNFFEQFSMKYLNLSFNNFEGEVPMRGVFANQSAISVVGNDKLCGGMPELHLHKCLGEESKKRQGRSRTLIIVVSSICTLSCITMMLVILFCRHKKTRKLISSGPLSKEPFLRVSYAQLFKATDGFSRENLIGRGSFGSVYKGHLDVDELVVAVKVLNLESRGASKSFMMECQALRNVRHRNLVKIITSCSSVDFHGNDFKALVYNFMPNGSLEWWLYSSQETQNEQGDLHSLSLLQRINIAIDVACALDYLHHQCESSIIHCDLKPSNILLDEDMVAHVGDFGLAKFLFPKLKDSIQSSSTDLRGTIGYVAPEYGFGSEISSNGDVYSFGILLLEMITGKRPTDNMFKDGLNLHNFASKALLGHVQDIVDPLILANNEEAITEAMENNNGVLTCANITEECLVSAIKIGVACSVESPQARMSMTKAFHELNLVRNTILQQL